MVDINKTENNVTINVSTTSSEAENNIIPKSDAVSYYNNLAKQWAVKTDGTVDGSENSAKYYAQQAKSHAIAAEDSKSSILNNSGFIATSADLTGNNNIGTCAANISSIQNAASNAQIAETKAALATEQAELAADYASQANSVLANSANTDLSNITEDGINVIKENADSGVPLLSIRPALYIDESLGLDYYLNGQLLTINANLQEGVNELKKLQAINPELFITEEEWQASITASPNSIVNAFVLDEEAGTLRLPKYPDYIYGGNNPTVPVVGNGKAMGYATTVGLLHPGYWQAANMGGYGQTTTGNDIGSTVGLGTRNLGAVGLSTNAGTSNVIAETTNSTEKLTLKYVIRLATGQETRVYIRNTIESLTPYTLFDSKYSETKLYNPAWILGSSILPKSVYVTAYEAALAEYNSEIADGTTVELTSGGSYTKRGISGGLTVKHSTDETATEYDWKLDTEAETLTVPAKSKYIDSNITQELYLYFFVAEASQNASLANLGRIEEQFAESKVVVESYSNGTSWYRIWSDNWCQQGGIYNVPTSGTKTSINLLKEIKNNAGAQVSQYNAASAGTHTGFRCCLVSTSTLEVAWANAGTPAISWLVTGYTK